MIDLGHWECNLEIPENPYGFVYCITNKILNKKYIGKKQMVTKKKRPPLKGKKRKRSSIVETDWKSYTSSSNELNADIEKNGKENFKFEILMFCDSKSAMAYYEAKKQFEVDALLRNDYYNSIVNLRISKIAGVSKSDPKINQKS